jgi:hypothetical protein
MTAADTLRVDSQGVDTQQADSSGVDSRQADNPAADSVPRRGRLRIHRAQRQKHDPEP